MIHIATQIIKIKHFRVFFFYLFRQKVMNIINNEQITKIIADNVGHCKYISGEKWNDPQGTKCSVCERYKK
jgi:hypothetical protein